ncbi:MAG: DUF4870 domain-containing protein [Blastocatellia bacterium]
MSNQPPYGNPPGGGGYPPPPGGGYPPPPGGGGYPPPGGGYPPPGGGGYQGGGGGYPPPGGNYPPPNGNKTKTFGMAYNTAALLCYLPTCLCCVNLIFSIIWMATEPKENRFVRFHALQGLLLFGVNFVIQVILNIASVATRSAAVATDNGMVYFAGGGILGIIGMIVGLAFLVLHVIGMIKASQGQWWKLPVIGDIAEKNA